MNVYLGLLDKADWTHVYNQCNPSDACDIWYAILIECSVSLLVLSSNIATQVCKFIICKKIKLWMNDNLCLKKCM